MAILATIFTAIWTGIKVAFMFVYKAIVWTVQMIVKILKAIWEFITQHAGTFFRSIGRFFLSFFRWIGNLFVKGWRFIAGLFTGMAAAKAAKPKSSQNGSSRPVMTLRRPEKSASYTPASPKDAAKIRDLMQKSRDARADFVNSGKFFDNFINGLTGSLSKVDPNRATGAGGAVSGFLGGLFGSGNREKAIGSQNTHNDNSPRGGSKDDKFIVKMPGWELGLSGRNGLSAEELAYFDYQRDKTQRHKKEEFEWQQAPKDRQANRHYDLVSTGKILYKDGKANSDAAVIAADRNRYLRDQKFRENFEHKWAKKAASPLMRNRSPEKQKAAKSRLFLREQKKVERAAMFDDAWNAASLMRSQSAAERKAQKAAQKQREYEDYRAEYYRKQQHKRDMEKIYANNRKH